VKVIPVVGAAGETDISCSSLAIARRSVDCVIRSARALTASTSFNVSADHLTYVDVVSFDSDGIVSAIVGHFCMSATTGC
jgi:hypothetical protein